MRLLDNCGNGSFVGSVGHPGCEQQQCVAAVPSLNQAVPHNDYVAQCESKPSGRRVLTISLALFGAVAAGRSMLIGEGTRTGFNTG